MEQMRNHALAGVQPRRLLARAKFLVPWRMASTSLVPELDVVDVERAIQFYVDLLDFRVVFRRHDERFAYLAHEDAELMLQEAAGPGRRFRTAPLEPPFGRGINFQLAVTDVDAVYERFRAAGRELVVAIEERWYRVDVEAPGAGGPRRDQRKPGTGSSSPPTPTATFGARTKTSGSVAWHEPRCRRRTLLAMSSLSRYAEPAARAAASRGHAAELRRVPHVPKSLDAR